MTDIGSAQNRADARSAATLTAVNQTVRGKTLQALLALEALAASGLSALLMVLLIVERPENLTAAIFEIFFALAVSATLWKATFGPHLRSAAILINIIALPVSKTLFQSDQPWIAIPVGLLALATLVGLFLDRKLLS